MRRPLMILALAAAVAAGACGGGSPAASGTTTTTVDPEEAMLEFARCMREHGVDMPDPGTEGEGRFTIRARPGDEDDLGEAQEACREHLDDAGPGSLDPEDREKLQDAMVAFARCMRSKGIDMPDPQASGGGIVMRARPGQRLDADEPGFAAAERECRKTTLEPVEKDLGIDPPRRSEGRG